MSDVNNEQDPWDRILGPFYTVTSASRLLNITEDELLEKVKRLEVLCTVTSDEVSLFPAFQFIDGEVLEGLSEVLPILQSGIDDPWTWGMWLTAKVGFDDEPKVSAVDLILAGDKESVLLEASHDAWAWSN